MKTRVRAVIDVPLDIDDIALAWLTDSLSDAILIWSSDQPETVSYKLHFEREELEQ